MNIQLTKRNINTNETTSNAINKYKQQYDVEFKNFFNFPLTFIISLLVLSISLST